MEELGWCVCMAWHGACMYMAWHVHVHRGRMWWSSAGACGCPHCMFTLLCVCTLRVWLWGAHTSRGSGRWMSEMLRSRGYIRWHQNKPAVRAIGRNAFPPIRKEPLLDRYADFLGVLEAHFELERSWASHQLRQQEHAVEIGSAFK